MRIITVVKSEWDNPQEAFGTGPGTGYVPSKCQLLMYFIDSKMLFYLFFPFFPILTSLKSVCFSKLTACQDLNGGNFSFLVVSKTMVHLTIGGVSDLAPGAWCCEHKVSWRTVGIWGMSGLWKQGSSSPWSLNRSIKWQLNKNGDRPAPLWRSPHGFKCTCSVSHLRTMFPF